MAKKKEQKKVPVGVPTLADEPGTKKHRMTPPPKVGRNF